MKHSTTPRSLPPCPPSDCRQSSTLQLAQTHRFSSWTRSLLTSEAANIPLLPNTAFRTLSEKARPFVSHEYEIRMQVLSSFILLPPKSRSYTVHRPDAGEYQTCSRYFFKPSETAGFLLYLSSVSMRSKSRPKVILKMSASPDFGSIEQVWPKAWFQTFAVVCVQLVQRDVQSKSECWAVLSSLFRGRHHGIRVAE